MSYTKQVPDWQKKTSWNSSPLIAQYDLLQARKHGKVKIKPEPEPGDIVYNMILAHNRKISIFKEDK